MIQLNSKEILLTISFLLFRQKLGLCSYNVAAAGNAQSTELEHYSSQYKSIFLLQSILHSLFQQLVTTKFLPVNANMSFPSGGLTSKKN